MSSAIQSVMQETRVFPPSAEFAKAAAVASMDAYNALCKKAVEDYEGLLGQTRAGTYFLAQALHEGARREQRSLLQVV